MLNNEARYAFHTHISGISVLASALQQIQTAGLSGREKQDFADLVKGLMNTATLPVVESLHILIEPYLGVQSEENLEGVALPLELLKVNKRIIVIVGFVRSVF